MEAAHNEKGAGSASMPAREGIPYVRLAITGMFMGLANLVPGVSGGTMVLALGLYDDFIGAMSDITRFRFSLRAIVVLAMLFGISFVTIFILAGVIQFLMEMFLPGMLALFIGMTLGGAPMLYKQMKPLTPTGILFAVIGIAIMAAIAFVLKPDTSDPNFVMLFIGGVVGSSAMILPGISGSYMLLILGLYLPIIAGISDMKDALRGADVSLFMSRAFGIALPVGLGLMVGIVVLSNLLKFMMEKYHRPTIGFLMGLLLGSVLGLYPFKTQSFEKLPRYAVQSPLAGVDRAVLVRGYGFDETHSVARSISSAAVDGVAIRFLSADPDRVPGEAEIALSRAEGSVIVAYDVNVPRAVRRAAEDKKAGKVELMIVPNAEFSPLKGVMVVALVLFGILLTLGLGRLGKKDGAPAH